MLRLKTTREPIDQIPGDQEYAQRTMVYAQELADALDRAGNAYTGCCEMAQNVFARGEGNDTLGICSYLSLFSQRIRAVIETWEAQVSNIDYQEVANEVISVLDGADCECEDRQRVRDLVEGHYG